MSTPNSIFAQFCLDVQSSAIAAGLVSGQVLIGAVEFEPTQNFYADVQENGFYLIIQMPEGNADMLSCDGDFKVVAQLFYPVPADASYNFVKENNQIAKLIDYWWGNFTPWNEDGNRNPRQLTWSKPTIRYHEKPNVVSTRFEFTQPLIAGQASNPGLSPAA